MCRSVMIESEELENRFCAVMVLNKMMGRSAKISKLCMQSWKDAHFYRVN